MSKIVSIEQFRQYTGNYEDNPLHQIYIDSAEDIVLSYLNYSPMIKDYDVFVSGTGDYKLYLPSRDIEGVYLLEVDGINIDLTDILWKEEYIYDIHHRKIFTNGDDNIHVQFLAGFRKMPELIPITILRIAALMLSEEGGNIGLTGKSFADQSRTFVSYTNYDKYLEPLNSLRIVKF